MQTGRSHPRRGCCSGPSGRRMMRIGIEKLGEFAEPMIGHCIIRRPLGPDRRGGSAGSTSMALSLTRPPAWPSAGSRRAHAGRPWPPQGRRSPTAQALAASASERVMTDNGCCCDPAEVRRGPAASCGPSNPPGLVVDTPRAIGAAERGVQTSLRASMAAYAVAHLNSTIVARCFLVRAASGGQSGIASIPALPRKRHVAHTKASSA